MVNPCTSRSAEALEARRFGVLDNGPNLLHVGDRREPRPPCKRLGAAPNQRRVELVVAQLDLGPPVEGHVLGEEVEHVVDLERGR